SRGPRGGWLAMRFVDVHSRPGNDRGRTPEPVGSDSKSRRRGSNSRNGTSGLPGVVARNVATVAELEADALAHRSTRERWADRIAQMAGTPGSAIVHMGWFGVWILVNVGLLPILPVFDPFPFPFLTLVVSLEAIFLSIFVLVSQNLLTRQADRRALLDLQINLLAEQESTRT